MPPDATIVHAVPGRMRFRVAAQRHNAEFFADLSAALLRLRGVTEATANPATAGVFVRCSRPSSEVCAAIEGAALVRFADAAAVLPSAQERLGAGLRSMSNGLKSITHGTIDLNSAAFITLTGLAIYQAIKGDIVAPSVTLLWYALSSTSLVDRA